MCVSPPRGAASTPPAQCCSRTPRSHMRSSPALSDQDCPTVKHVADGKAGLLAHIPCVFCRCQRLSRLMTAVATPAHCHAAAACASRLSSAQLQPLRTASHPHISQPRALLFGIARPRRSNAEAYAGWQGWIAGSHPMHACAVPMPLSPRGGCCNACNCAYCHAAAGSASRLPRAQLQLLPHSAAPTHLTSICAPLWHRATKTIQR